MNDVPKTIEVVWKIESTRLIAAIARVTHDIGIAEELAQDALVTTLELRPEEGTTFCASSSPRAIRCSRWKHASPLRCA